MNHMLSVLDWIVLGELLTLFPKTFCIFLVLKKNEGVSNSEWVVKTQRQFDKHLNDVKVLRYVGGKFWKK